MSKKLGRPTRFTKTMGDRICADIREGKTMSKICEPEGMPHKSQIFRWLSMPSLKSFRDRYDNAVKDRADAWAEEVVEIADESVLDTYEDDEGTVHINREVVQRSKLRVETRLKLMSKVAPHKYGDKVDITSNNKPVRTVAIFDMRRGTPLQVIPVDGAKKRKVNKAVKSVAKQGPKVNKRPAPKKK